MILMKCPRCDLNYITENEKFCKVCLQEMKGSKPEDEVEMCSVCNAAPALAGRDVCLSCLKEMNGETEDDEGQGSTVRENEVDIDTQSDLDDMVDNDGIEEDEDLKRLDKEMDEELSLEAMKDEEEEDEEEEEKKEKNEDD